jgi:hypothetical protein
MRRIFFILALLTIAIKALADDTNAVALLKIGTADATSHSPTRLSQW